MSAPIDTAAAPDNDRRSGDDRWAGVMFFLLVKTD